MPRKAVSYTDYLKVNELLGLQQRLSEPRHHDEMLFIIIHQVYELWFREMIHEAEAVMGALGSGKVRRATRLYRRMIEIQRVLLQQIAVLETMTPVDFNEFRDLLNPASGFQSMQFREIEFSSGAKDRSALNSFHDDEFATERLEARFASPSIGDAFYGYLRRCGFDAPADDVSHSDEERRKSYGGRTQAILEILTHFEERHEEFQLAESLIEHDECFSLWRTHHILMVERMVGHKRGTGGSEGVGYLRTTLDKKFFPELWEARTYLDRKHGEGGCPFAG